MTNMFQGSWVGREDGDQTSLCTSALTNYSCFENEETANRKLDIYGRNEEMNALNQAYQSVKNTGRAGVVFVHGQAGSGKTSLVETMREAVVISGGYFVAGKFDQIPVKDPYSALVAALDDLCDLIGQSDRMEVVKKDLLETLGDELQGFARLVSGVTQITGVGTEDTLYGDQQFSLGHAFIRFKQQCRSFLRCCVSSKDHPVVLFLDDLQFANDDKESLEIIHNLMASGIANTLIVGAYRDDQGGSHEVMIDQVKKILASSSSSASVPCPVRDIHLNNLTEHQVIEMVSGVLELDTSKTEGLGAICYTKTSGNPYFVVQYLMLLESEGLLYFSTGVERWEWDESKVRSETNVTSNILEVITERAQNTSQEVCNLLKLAACFGFKFDLGLLLRVAEAQRAHNPQQNLSSTADSEEISKQLRSIIAIAEKERFIEKVNVDVYKWTHDRAMQCFESLIPLSEKCSLHIRIGELTESLDNGPTSFTLRFIVDQLNLGVSCIVDKKKRVALARRNLAVGEIALSKSGFSSGRDYFEKGIALLPEAAWVSHYDLTLRLYTRAMEAAHSTGDRVVIDKMVNAVLLHGKTAENRIVANKLRVSMLAAQGRFDDSMAVARRVLRELGVKIPLRPTVLHVMYDLIATHRAVRGKSDTEILALPTLDARRTMAMQILSTIVRYTFYESPELVAVVSLRMMRISLKHGLCKYSPPSFTMFGVFQVSLKKYDDAFRFGMLSIRLMEELQSTVAEARTVTFFYACIHHWKRPIFEATEYFNQSYYRGLKVGDVEFSLGCGMDCAHSMLVSGLPLDEASTRMRQVYDQMVEFNDLSNLFILCPIFQTILNLSGEADNPARLTGEVMVEEELLQRLLAEKNELNVYIVLAECHQLACFFGAWYLAGDYMRRMLKLKSASTNLSTHYGSSSFRLLQGLTYLAEFRASGQRQYMTQYRRHKKFLSAFEAKGVNTYIPVLCFFRAQEASLKGNKAAVQSAYSDAVASFAEGRYLNYEGLCNEHAGDAMMLRFSDIEAATVFYMRSRQKYSEWKAWAKVDHVQKKLDKLAITEAQGLPFTISEE